MFIYKIINKLDGKIYIGQTRQTLEKRFLQHSQAFSPLGYAIRKDGLENFAIEVIEECETQEQADERERFFIAELKSKVPNGYNRSDGGTGNFANYTNKKDASRRPLIVPEIFLNQTYYGSKDIDRAITITRYKKSTTEIPHKHPYFEIVYVYRGQCTQNIGFDSLSLHSGDLIITAPETLHTLEVNDDADIIFEINLRREGFYEIFAPLVKGSHTVNKFFAEGLHNKSPIKYLLFHTANDTFISENILRMFAKENHLMRCHLKDFEMCATQPTNLPDNFLIMNYIQENLATVTLENLAAQFNFSVSRCSRLIKATTGANFNEWKKILRLKRAKYLLTNTSQSIAEISSALGWLNAENFIRSFQKNFGISPIRYRIKNGTCPENNTPQLMLGLERRQKILEKLKQENRVYVSQLSKIFDVTEETIRRDLDKLEEEDLIRRDYGGAVLNSYISEDLSFLKRSLINGDLKNLIAKTAQKLIDDDSTIMMDSSTTCLALLNLLRQRKNLTIITNSIRLAYDFSGVPFKIISVGGTLRAKSFALTGAITCNTLRNYFVDYAILSCKGIDIERGVMESNDEESAVKQVMIAQAKKVILLVDSSKFDKISFTKTCDFSKISILVTDREPSEDWKISLDAQQVRLLY